MTLTSDPPECWGYRLQSPHQLLQDGVEARASHMLGKRSATEPHARLSFISVVEKGHTAPCSDSQHGNSTFRY